MLGGAWDLIVGDLAYVPVCLPAACLARCLFVVMSQVMSIYLFLVCVCVHVRISYSILLVKMVLESAQIVHSASHVKRLIEIKALVWPPELAK